jgi:hypothetical protein
MLKYDFDRRAMIRIDLIKQKIVEHVSLNPGCTIEYIISKMKKEHPPLHATRMTTRKYLAELKSEGVIRETKVGNGLPSELYVNNENMLVILPHELKHTISCFRTLSRSLVAAINSNKSSRLDVEEEVCDILDGLTDHLFTLMKSLMRSYVMYWSWKIKNKSVLARLHELILSALANIQYMIIIEVGMVKGIEDFKRTFYANTERLWNDFTDDVRIPKEDFPSICNRLDVWAEYLDLLDALYYFSKNIVVRFAAH